MQIAEGTELFILGDEGLLFSERAQRLYRLNTSAAYIWFLLEDGLDDAEILAALQQTFDLSPEQAGDYMHKSELVLQEIAEADSLEEIDQSSLQWPVLEDEDKAATTAEIVAERHYQLLGSSVCIRFSDVAQLELIDPILHHLRKEKQGSFDIVLDVIYRDDQIYLVRDDNVYFTSEKLESIGPLAKSLVWQAAVLNRDFFLDIHAGVVSDGKQCFIFPAAPGSGKSTLVTILMASGFELFSDEIALIHEAGFTVSPAPLSIGVKDAGVDVVAEYYPQVRALARHHRSDGKWVRYLPPASFSDADVARPVGAIIFPQYDPEAETCLKPLQGIDAMQRLMDECLLIPSGLDKEKVRRLVEWVESTPCYSLAVSDSAKAVSLVRSLSG